MNHPLVKKEWKLLRWTMLLYGCIFTFFTLILSDNMTRERTYHLLGERQEGIFISQLYMMNNLMVPVLLVTIMIVVAILFIHDKNNHIGKFINCLPYTRKQYFRIKYIMGMATFTVPLTFFGIALYIIRGSHLNWISRIYRYSPYEDLLKAQDGAGVLFMWLVFLWLMMLSTYSFLMMVQTLMGQSIVASIVGGTVCLVPLFLIYAIPANLSLLGMRIVIYRRNLSRWIRLFLLGTPESELIVRNSALGPENFIDYYGRYFEVFNYQWFPLYMAILVGVIIISTLIGYYFTQIYDVEKNGEIALYSWVEKILIIGVTVCSLLLLPILIRILTGIQNSILTLMTMMIGGILGYWISKKSIELTTKHG